MTDVVFFYTYLGMKDNEVKRAEQEANSNDPCLTAWNVLLRWRQLKGNSATRDAIIEAMEAMRQWTEPLETIKEEWNKQNDK